MANHSADFLRLAGEAKQRIIEVTPAEAKKLFDSGAIVLDVRDREEFEAEHLKGAAHLSRGKLEMQIHEIAPDKHSMIICYCNGGNRGALAADTLRAMGYSRVHSIQGGLRACASLPESSPLSIESDSLSRART